MEQESVAAMVSKYRLSVSSDNLTVTGSDVVIRKLSSTIGWKQFALPSQDIITQGKCLRIHNILPCQLKRSGVLNRKLGLQ